jgi:hypothetical protein
MSAAVPPIPDERDRFRASSRMSRHDAENEYRLQWNVQSPFLGNSGLFNGCLRLSHRNFGG